MASVGDGVRDGFVGVTSVPITRTKVCKRWYGAIEAISARGADRERIAIKGSVCKFLILRWRRGRFTPFFALGAPESNGRPPGCELYFRFAGCSVKNCRGHVVCRRDYSEECTVGGVVVSDVKEPQFLMF